MAGGRQEVAGRQRQAAMEQPVAGTQAEQNPRQAGRRKSQEGRSR